MKRLVVAPEPKRRTICVESCILGPTAPQSTLVRNLIRIAQDGNEFFSAPPGAVLEAIRREINAIPEEYQFAIDGMIAELDERATLLRG